MNLNFLERFKFFFTLYKELFILLGIILLVWLAVALIIKIFIRKPETWDDDEIEDDETEKYETEDEE
ncbi:MAG TPA: hypothetical protein PK111_03400 [Atribacterota bacterium]|nr:hypothetical protein [Atribacterota bacterium]HPK87049.1 hypothetical protein [Atribacterota bacterium]